MTKHFELYVRPNWPDCQKTIDWLEKHHQRYTVSVIDVNDVDMKHREWSLKKIKEFKQKGLWKLPVVKANNDNYMGERGVQTWCGLDYNKLKANAKTEGEQQVA